MKPVMVRIPDDLLDHLDALAERHGVDRSHVIRTFLEAGRSANPAPTPSEIMAVRARRAGRPAVRGGGLVVPIAPLAHAGEGVPDSGVEEMGIEPGRGARRALALATRRRAA